MNCELTMQGSFYFLFVVLLLQSEARDQRGLQNDTVVVENHKTSVPESPELQDDTNARIQLLDQPTKYESATKEASRFSKNELLALRLLGRDVIERLGLLRLTKELDHPSGKYSLRNRSLLFSGA